MPRRYSLRVATAWPSGAGGFDALLHCLAIGGPLGLIPWVPATWTSLATAAVVWWWQPSAAWLLIAVAVVFVVGGFAAGTAERLSQTHDPRNVVIDEIAGQMLAFVGLSPFHWPRALAGFALFRLFDVLKPFPARRLEDLPAGWGIMADDIAAGIYALIGLWLLRFWVH